MEFLNYRLIKSKLKKRGILFKKPSLEDASNQFYALARQLEDHQMYSGFCHLAMTNCQASKLGAFLNAARAFSRAKDEIISTDDYIRLVVWMYTEALLICDRSLIRPIRLEMGRFYENNKMYDQAAECFKQSMSISRCVHNLILAKRYRNALEELKNCPSHLMTSNDHTSLFLLELLFDELDGNASQPLTRCSHVSTDRGLLPIDDHLYDLTILLESLLIFHKDKKHDGSSAKEDKLKSLILDKLSAFLDPAQTQLLHLLKIY